MRTATLVLLALSSSAFGQQYNPSPPPGVPPISMFTGTGQANADWVKATKFNPNSTWKARIYREFVGILTVTQPDGKTFDIRVPKSAVRASSASISTTVSASGSISFNGWSSSFVNDFGSDPQVGDAYTGALPGLPVGTTATWKTVVPGRTENNAPRLTIYVDVTGTHLAWW